MHRAGATGCFLILKRAICKALNTVGLELVTAFTKISPPMVVGLAVKPDHSLYRFYLTLHTRV